MRPSLLQESKNVCQQILCVSSLLTQKTYKRATVSLSNASGREDEHISLSKIQSNSYWQVLVYARKHQDKQVIPRLFYGAVLFRTSSVVTSVLTTIPQQVISY